MSKFKSRRTRQIARVIKFGILWPGIILLLSQPVWMPYYYQWRCSRIASELEQQYGLVVRYGDPSEFYVSPLNPQKNNPETGLSIAGTDKHSALTALKGIRQALQKYPKDLLEKKLSAVFVPGKFTIHNIAVGGTILHSWVYVVAADPYGHDSAVVNWYEEVFHHELSSLFFNDSSFPALRWHLVNKPDFKYLPSQDDVIEAAASEKHRDPKEAPSWYKAGFVDDYGMASMENDLNTYAQIAMTYPEKLRSLADKYPRIQAKTWLLVDFYSSLSPELGEYLASKGLTKSPDMAEMLKAIGAK